MVVPVILKAIGPVKPRHHKSPLNPPLGKGGKQAACAAVG